MKREKIADLWGIGILLLALSVLIPFPWVEFKIQSIDDPSIIVYKGVNPASDITSKNGPFWTSTLVLICVAIIIGVLFIFSLFRWSINKDSQLWYWGEITIEDFDYLLIRAKSFLSGPQPINHDGNSGGFYDYSFVFSSPVDGSA